MGFLAKWGAAAWKFLLPLGGTGLFAAALLDSSFVPLPQGVDLWLISLSVLQPTRMPLYVALAVAGSTLGCCALYLVALRAEEKYLENNPKYPGLPRIRRLVEKYEIGALVIGAILPPPMPFKLVVIAAGLVKCRFDRFVIGIVIGRAIRYLVEGWLAIHYGRQVWMWFLRTGPKAFGMVLIAILLAYLLQRIWAKSAAVGSKSPSIGGRG